jgi:pilus assembly protein CpaF
VFDFYYQIGTHRRKLFQAVGSHCSIGSARSNDLVIDSRQLSKRQAELRLEDSGVYIRDLGSLTGCWVNRERVVERGPLSDLDEIEIGDVRVTLKAIRLPLTPMSNAGSAEDWPEKVSNANQHTTEQTVLQPSDDQPSEDHSNMPSPHDEALAYWGRIVHEQLLFQMDLQRKDVNRMSDESLRRESLDLIKNIVAGLHDQLPESVDHEQLISNVLNESVGLGPLEEFLQDESITEIMVNNYREIFIERNGKLEQSRVTFSSDATVSAVIDRIISPLGRRIDESSPIVDARLKDGSRVNAIIPPLALKGPSLTIRKFPKNRLKFSDLVASDAISQSMVDFLKVCVEMRKNIIVSGGTGSGKTTLLNVLSNFIPATDRIVTIEDAAELKLAQPNLVSLESRPPNLEGRGEIPIRDLVRNSLRMRPDRIVVGECRGGEALDMLQAMNTGHNGSLTTIHANNPRDVLSRLEVLVLMAGMELPISAIREQVASAVDLIIQQTRFPCGARKITKITEVVGVESGTVQLQDIFTYGQRGVDDQGRVQGNFVATGAIPTFYEELRNLGYEVDLSSFSSATERVHA